MMAERDKEEMEMDIAKMESSKEHLSYAEVGAP